MYWNCCSLPPFHPTQINGRLNADIVGQSVQRLAEIFGIKVPEWAKVLVAEVRGQGGTGLCEAGISSQLCSYNR